MITFRHKKTGVTKPANTDDAVEARNWLETQLIGTGETANDWTILATTRVENALDTRAAAKETRG